MRLLYDRLLDAFGTPRAPHSVDEEHRLSMQLERDVSSDQTTAALYRLTVVTGGLALLARSSPQQTEPGRRSDGARDRLRHGSCDHRGVHRSARLVAAP